jgi:hypothetical protein
MMPAMQITVPFEITRWDEEPYDKGEGNELARATVEKAFAADRLSGTSAAQLFLVRTAGEPQGAAYTAVERFQVVLGGREGTFVLVHGATSEVDADDVSRGHVVPGSGTGGLEGLRGTAAYAHDEDGPRLTLDYELPGQA